MHSEKPFGGIRRGIWRRGRKKLREDFESGFMSEEELAKALTDKILEAIAGGAFKTEGDK